MQSVNPGLILSDPEVDFLVDYLRDEGLRHHLEHVESHKSSSRISGQALLNLETHEVPLLLQELGDLLAELGFDESYRPNATGLLIEGLIDKVSRLRWP
jgi:hypothetical protein